jgi:hypothetical protein
MAPSKTNQLGGAKAIHEEGKVVSHFTSEDVDLDGSVLELKPRAYSSGEARMWNSMEVVLLASAGEGRGASSYCENTVSSCTLHKFRRRGPTYNLSAIPDQ